MNAIFVAILIAAMLLSLVAAPVFAPSAEIGYKWAEDRHLPISPGSQYQWWHSGNTADIPNTDEYSAAQNAFNTWESDTGSFLDFTNMGTTSNGANSVTGWPFNSPDGTQVIEYDASLSCTEFNRPLAVTNEFERADYMLDVDTAMNDGCHQFSITSTPDDWDLETIVLHEVGHWFILDDLTTDTTQLMRANLLPGVHPQRYLEWGDQAGVRYIYPNTYTITSSLGTNTQDADLAAGNLVSLPDPADYIFAWSDKEDSTADDIKYMVGTNVNSGTGQPSSWGSVNSPTQLQNLANDIQGVAVAMTTIDGDSTTDLVVAWIDNLSGDNQIKYKIGWDLNTSGVPTNGWSTTKTVDTSNIGTESSGLGIGFADTPDSGTTKEMFVFWVDNAPILNDIYYKVGWNINTSGDPTGGTPWSNRVKADLGLFGPGAFTSGMGISLGNWLDSSDPDVIVFWVDEGALAGDNHGTYAVGEDVTSSGIFDWKPKDAFPGEWLDMGKNSQGAGVAILNANSGTRPEASFVWIDNPSGANVAKMRTEWEGRMGTGSHNSPGLMIKTVRQSDNTEITGLFINVYNSTHFIASGYSPLYIALPEDGTYYVDFSNYNQYYFTSTNTTSNYYVANWGGGRVTVDVVNGATVHGIYYDNNNPGNYVKMTYEAKDTNGNAISGMYGGFRTPLGTVITQGYSPYTVGVPKLQEMDVIWNNYGTHVYQRADLVPNDFEQSDNVETWGGTQRIYLNTAGPYIDTGIFTP